MQIGEKIRKFLEKLQNLPEAQKKIILWVIVAVLGIIMGFFWVRGTVGNFSKIGGSLQQIQLPKIDMPESAVSNLEKIKNTLDGISPSDLEKAGTDESILDPNENKNLK